MTNPLEDALRTLNDNICSRLKGARKALKHPTVKGDASENVWVSVLSEYLPKRYAADRGTVIDSEGATSDVIDVVIYDRQYSPFVLSLEGQRYFAAESIYAVFEAKQTVNGAFVSYAGRKVASVRALQRTSIPIPTADKLLPPKAPHRILGGLLALSSDWQSPMGRSLTTKLRLRSEAERLELGCVAEHGYWSEPGIGGPGVTLCHSPAAAFVLELIARLQTIATVPMLDVRAYARWAR